MYAFNYSHSLVAHVFVLCQGEWFSIQTILQLMAGVSFLLSPKTHEKMVLQLTLLVSVQFLQQVAIRWTPVTSETLPIIGAWLFETHTCVWERGWMGVSEWVCEWLSFNENECVSVSECLREIWIKCITLLPCTSRGTISAFHCVWVCVCFVFHKPIFVCHSYVCVCLYIFACLWFYARIFFRV